MRQLKIPYGVESVVESLKEKYQQVLLCS